jgi:O-antigen/teichoic acid export membrane protein
MALLVIPAAAVLAAFAPEALWVWTHDPSAVSNASRLLAILAAGTALNGLTAMPYALQLASGWPQLSLWWNAVALALGAPAMWMLARTQGAAGAASVWVAVNLLFLLVTVQLMHRRILPRERGRWYRNAVLVPIAAAAAATAFVRLLWREPRQDWGAVLPVAVAAVVALAVTAAVLPAARDQARSWNEARR